MKTEIKSIASMIKFSGCLKKANPLNSSAIFEAIDIKENSDKKMSPIVPSLILPFNSISRRNLIKKIKIAI